MDASMILAATGGAVAALTPAGFLLDRAYARLRQLRSEVELVSYDATHDGLTGLANRAAFYDRAGRRVAAGGAGRALLLLVDLDEFKHVNDSFGHGVGDLVLLEVAQRLRDVCGPDAVVARLGGDEFVVLLPLLDDETPAEAAQNVRTLTEADRVDFDGAAVWVRLSIGVAIVDGPADLAVLLGCADAALYRAKASGAGVAVYDATLDDHVTPMPGVRPDVRVRDLTVDTGVLAGAGGDLVGVAR